MNLLVLSHLIEDRQWTERIERTLKLFGARLDQAGRAVPMMAAALSAHTASTQQIVIVGETGAGALERTAVVGYRPFTITLALTPEHQQRLRDVMPLVAEMRPVDGAAAAYVCQKFACRAPATTVEALEQTLGAAHES